MKFHLAPLGGLLAAALLSLPSAAQSCDRIPISSLPFTIERSGSYYLTESLVSTAQNITVLAGDVTIDLNGFALLGNGIADNGIVAPIPVRNVAIQNGIIADWGVSGIQLGNVQQARLSRLEITDNQNFGIHNASGAVIEDCLITRNSQGGLKLLDGCSVRRCVVTDNGGMGIDALRQSTVEDCTLTGNSGGGVLVLEISVVMDNIVASNGGTGIRVDRQCRVLRNTVSSQTTGIRATSTRNEITDNLVTSCTLGIDVDLARSLIGRNSVGSNTVNFDVASGNLLGPLVTSANFATNTNPNANYQL